MTGVTEKRLRDYYLIDLLRLALLLPGITPAPVVFRIP
jgi:hypothetical protein